VCNNITNKSILAIFSLKYTIMKQDMQDVWTSKRLLSLLVISGLSISGMSFFILGDGFDNSASTLTNEFETLCDDGLCYNVATDIIP